jgi:hypothetical protein
MPKLHPFRSTVPALVVITALLLTGCGADDDEPDAAPATTSAPSSSPAPPVTTEGREDEVAPPDAAFPASTGDDSGEAQQGTGSDAQDDMWITGLRLSPQNGYDRLVIDLSSASVPPWTARYTDASAPAGDPVDVGGDSFLRIGLFTQSGDEQAEPPVVTAESGVVVEARATGSLGGYQEVLIGVRGTPAPFRAFALTDPGRLVIDIRPAG